MPDVPQQEQVLDRDSSPSVKKSDTPPEAFPNGQEPIPVAVLADDEGLALMRALHAAFEEKIKYDATRDRMIDRLHGELQEYKDDILLKMLRPLVLDLIVLHDNLGKWSSTGASTPPAVSFADVQTDLEDILYRYGYETFTVPENSFDARRQRILRTVPTEDVALDGKISERLRKGFLYGGKVIRPECVAVFKPIKSV